MKILNYIFAFAIGVSALVLVLACASLVRAQVYYWPSPDDEVQQRLRDQAQARQWQQQNQLLQQQNQILREMEQNQQWNQGFRQVPTPPSYPPPMGFGGMR